MTNPIKVLVVDDSMVIRRVLSKIIESDRAFELVGTARDGKDAVEKIQSLEPDVVTMDVEMPNVDGLEALPDLGRDLGIPLLGPLVGQVAQVGVFPALPLVLRTRG